METRSHYHPYLKLIHWLMALCILGMIASGWYMEGLPREHELKWTIYDLHKSFGVTVIGLFMYRVMLRLFTAIPKTPEGIKTYEKKLSHLVHFLLYGLMIAVPISGYVMSDAGDYGVKWFGFVLPDFIIKNKEIGGIAHEIHEIAPYVLLGLVGLHIAGALKHRFFEPRENDVLGSMLPSNRKADISE